MYNSSTGGLTNAVNCSRHILSRFNPVRHEFSKETIESEDGFDLLEVKQIL